MSILDTVRAKAKEASRAARRQARIGRHQVQARRLQGRLRGEQMAIGKAVYPLLKDGSLRVDDRGIQDAVARGGEIEVELEAVRETIDAIKSRADGFVPEDDGMAAAEQAGAAVSPPDSAGAEEEQAAS